ncbi:MAG: hypothetical protein VZS44_00590 [Bacilli bacterium]|nr:hypothetical protein [Bacilli bacterium]
MNMLKEVIEYLDQSNFNDFTKIRWIYLYVCEKFSYDMRYPYATNDLKEEILNKKVDLTNVEDFEHICYAYAHILTDLLTIYGFNCEIVKEVENRKLSHVYVIVRYKDKVLKLDPTKKHDTTRVKMRNGTLDFQTLIDDPTFLDELKEADNIIKEKYHNKEIDDDKYNYEEIMKIISSLEDNFSKNNTPQSERFFKKLEIIFKIVNSKTNFKKYDDIDYYFSYLLRKFKINDKQLYVKPAIFFKNDDKSMKDNINLILVEYHNIPPIFFILEKEQNKDNYHIREIDKNELLEKLDEYSNWQVDEYFRRKAKLSKPYIKL